MNVIVISNIDWGFLKQRHHYFVDAFLELKDINKVIYVESTGKRLPTVKDIPRIYDRLKSKVIKKNNSSKNINSKFQVFSPLALPSTHKYFKIINKIIFSKLISKELKKLCNEDEKVLFLIYLPNQTTIDIIESFDSKKVIYDCVTNYSSLESISPGISGTENILILESDKVIVDCIYLFDKHSAKRNDIEMIEPIVDYNLFSVCQEKDPPVQIQKLVYYGLISDKIDFQIVDELLNKGISLKFIGPKRDNITLDSRINYIGEVEHDHLPKHLNDSDAIIIPYLNNDFMQGVIPAKIFECMATGFPVIVPDLYNFKLYKDFLYLYKSKEELINLINSFDFNLDKNKRDKRINKAKMRDVVNVKNEIINVAI